MSYQTTTQREWYGLFVTVTGTRTFSAVSALAREVLEACVAGRCSRVLIDVRGFEGRLRPIEVYQLVTGGFPNFKGKGLMAAAIVDQP